MATSWRLLLHRSLPSTRGCHVLVGQSPPHRCVRPLSRLARPSSPSWRHFAAADRHRLVPRSLSPSPALPSSSRRVSVRATADASSDGATQATVEAPPPPPAAAAAVDPSVSGSALRRKFLDFYAARHHAVLPSASLVPDDPTVLLTIAGMLPFKPVFLGQVPPSVPRATTSQRCVRTNDVENVGRTARHHTFFEMLGNFSFGDYFKQEACQWAWQLATQEFGIPAERIWISVFREDDEAYSIWTDQVGVAPERIQRLGEDDNFWASGATGPCGPCSELYYDFHPERGLEGADLGDDTRFIEFYNLVFMESNRRDDGSLEPLHKKNIDTGLGLERLAQILQQVPSNYETDLIFPIIQRAAQLAGVDYHSSDERTKRMLKVIGDHARAVVHLVADGVNPSNIGRGYVVRRLVRRLVRMGRLLGINAGGSSSEGGNGNGSAAGASGSAFLPVIAQQVIAMSADINSGVAVRAERIVEELRREEERFTATLERGEKLLDDLLDHALAAAAGAGGATHGAAADGAGAEGQGEAASGPVLSGRDVFVLYDTFGFPVEITEEVARERGVAVDLEGFEREMAAQRRQSQAAHSAIKLAVGSVAADLAGQLPETEFVGYTCLASSSPVLALVGQGKVVERAAVGQEVDVVLARTPFYAEGGGQIGDWGHMRVAQGEGGAQAGGGVVRVRDVQRAGGGLWLHRGVVEEGEVCVGDEVEAVVDEEQRLRSQAHHTATHLLQSALRAVLGPDVAQAGSLVAFDRLRFDFHFPRALAPAEVAQVEAMVNAWIAQGAAVTATVMPIDDAKAAGAIAMFGEKYGDEVRVIDVPGISMELCGGTHVGNTAAIRAFKVLSEAGIAAGVRRMEAVAGAAAVELLNQWDGVLKTLSSSLKVKAEEVPSRVAALQDELRAARTEADSLRGELAVARAQLLLGEAVSVGEMGCRLLVAELPGVTADALKTAAESLSARLAAADASPSAVVLASGSEDEGKVAIVAVLSPEVVKAGVNAGKLVGAMARVCGGGGGGRPNFAQAGGRQPEKLQEALALGRGELVKQLGA
ncbi:hypothetical protein CLOM_g1241 [Closterium sp. NIES-68]|nr:hypothetical protein CLOM_g1241 [Closterium sp. NIES-68]GJP67241.1 hypothetical protein CLOP_g24084 [Closterium sp. NIES-67]